MPQVFLLTFLLLSTCCLAAEEPSLAAADRLFEERRPQDALSLYRALVERHRDELDISVRAVVQMVACYQLLRGNAAVAKDYPVVVGRFLNAPPDLDGSSLPATDRVQHDLLWKSWTGPGLRLRLQSAKPMVNPDGDAVLDLTIVAEGHPRFAANGAEGPPILTNELLLSSPAGKEAAGLVIMTRSFPDEPAQTPGDPGPPAAFGRPTPKPSPEAPSSIQLCAGFRRLPPGADLRLTGWVSISLLGLRRTEEIPLKAGQQARMGPFLLSGLDISTDRTVVTLVQRNSTGSSIKNPSPAIRTLGWSLFHDGREIPYENLTTQSDGEESSVTLKFRIGPGKSVRLRRFIAEISSEQVAIDARIDPP